MEREAKDQFVEGKIAQIEQERRRIEVANSDLENVTHAVQQYKDWLNEVTPTPRSSLPHCILLDDLENANNVNDN